MRSVPLVIVLLLATAAPSLAQQARFPWRPGDRAPAVAGLRLKDSRARIDSLLGSPDTQQAMGSGVVSLGYRSRGLTLVYSEADSLAVIDLNTSAAGDIDSVRVGDMRERVLARWGQPTTVDGGNALWVVGAWVVVVRLGPQNQVAILSLGRSADNDQ